MTLGTVASRHGQGRVRVRSGYGQLRIPPQQQLGGWVKNKDKSKSKKSSPSSRASSCPNMPQLAYFMGQTKTNAKTNALLPPQLRPHPRPQTKPQNASPDCNSNPNPDFFFFFFNPPADGEKKSFSSPQFHVFSYASCVDLTQLISQPNASCPIVGIA